MAPKISDRTFTAMMWGGVALCALFLCLRIYFRIKASRKLFAEDVIIVLAWLMQLARSIILQLTKRAMFLHPASNDEEEYLPHLPIAVATSVLFLTGLWTIKLSFLLFFRRLGQRVIGQKKIWWLITVLTFVMGLVCLVIPWWECLQGIDGKSNEKCTGSRATELKRAALQVGTVLDIVTDALIVVLPFRMLWKVQLNWRQKLAPGGILLFIMFVIIFAIVRATVAAVGQAHADEIQLYLWSNIELTGAIITACISPFRQFYTRQERGPGQARAVVDRITTYFNHMRGRKQTTSSITDDIPLAPYTGSSVASPSSSSIDPTDPIVPLDSIRVRYDLEVSPEL